MSKLRKPGELITPNSIKVLLYGSPGVGKSTLALSAPSPVNFDFDRGTHRVSSKHQVDTLQVDSWEDVIDVLNEDLSAYKTFVMDTAGKMLDYMAAYIIKNDPKLAKRDGSLSLQGYGARKAMFANFLAKITMMNKHIIFVAHDKEEKDGDTKFIRPEIGGSSGNDLIREIDLVGYAEMIGKKRTISFDPCEKFYGKNTCHLETIIELPDLNSMPNNLMTTIFERYAKSLEDRKKVADEYNALLTVIKDGIEAANDVQSLNDLIPWAQTLEAIWDSKLQAKLLISEQAKKLSAKFNKVTSKYELVKDEANATA